MHAGRETCRLKEILNSKVTEHAYSCSELKTRVERTQLMRAVPKAKEMELMAAVNRLTQAKNDG